MFSSGGPVQADTRIPDSKKSRLICEVRLTCWFWIRAVASHHFILIWSCLCSGSQVELLHQEERVLPMSSMMDAYCPAGRGRGRGRVLGYFMEQNTLS